MIVDNLKDFRNKLLKYIVYQKKRIEMHEKRIKEERADFASIYDEISISAGKYAPLIKEFTGLATIRTSAGQEDVWNWAFSYSQNALVLDALDKCLQATARTIGKLEDDIRTGKRDAKTGELMDKSGMFKSEPPKAFIAHEGETTALSSLKEFLEALGITYFIAEAEASGGRSVEKQVNWTQEQGDFAIILATKGKAIDRRTRKHYMGLNVADELGSARQIYGNHIILLVQRGVEVHTNKREIVYGEFTSTNMQKAFIKIAKELRNWGFLIVGKEETKK